MPKSTLTLLTSLRSRSPSRMGKGVSINDVHNIFGFFLPLALSVRHFYVMFVRQVGFFTIPIHDELKKIDCNIFTSFFLTKLVKTGNGILRVFLHK